MRLRGTAETQVHERTIIHRQSSFPLDVSLSERLREMLDRHARHQESVKGHTTRPGIVLGFGRSIPFLELADEVARQGVSKAVERLFEFLAIDRTGTITIELLEDVVPVLYREKLSKANSRKCLVQKYLDVPI
jgi:hypothetical protein